MSTPPLPETADGHNAVNPAAEQRDEAPPRPARRYVLRPFDYRTADLIAAYTRALARWKPRPEGGTGEGPG